MNADKVISIYKGDDTGGTLGKHIVIKVLSQFDLQGCVLIFNYQGVTRKYENVSVGDMLDVHFSHNETAQMSVGTFKATLIAIDAAGKRRTVTDGIRIKVTTNLAECYGSETEIEVRIGLAVNWDNIVNKPLDGRVVDIHTDDGVVSALGEIITALGGTPYEG